MSEDLNSLVVNPGRPAYRAGRKPIATRVYTINQESRYLVVENVPALGLTKELLELFALYGTIEEVAKKKVDDHIFFSSSLRVRYGPEYETIEDTRGKLRDRRTVISIKTNEQKEHENKTQSQEPPIPGVGYPSSFSTSFTPTSYKYHTDPNSSMSSTVNTIRQRINDASKVSSDKDKGNVNQISTDSSIKSTHTTTPTKRRRI
ncbi:6932_t:CDS:2 [Rhizophagus irregularis]|nr:6932_t:CDS:2 [Rhizophagus irregularis]